MGKKNMQEKLRRFKRLLAIIMCVIMATGTGVSSLAELGPLNIWIPLASDSNATAVSTEEETEGSRVVVASWSDATLSDATASNAINWQAELQVRIDALPSIAEIKEDETNELLVDTYWEVLDIMEVIEDETGVALYDWIVDADDGSIEGADELDVSMLYEVADYVISAYAALENYEQIDLDDLSFVTETITVEPEELAGKNQATMTLKVTGDADIVSPDSGDEDEVHENDYYLYYTNEQLTISFSIEGSLSGDYDYRIYFKPSDPAGLYSSLTEKSEMFEDYEGIEAQLVFSGLIDSGTYGALETGAYTALMNYDEDLEAWYLDFTDVPNAVTVSGTLKMTYPSPNTPGGDVLIFGVVYDEYGNVASTDTEAFDASWTTQPQTFGVTIALDETQSENGLILQADDGSTHVAVKNNPDQDIIYTISMTNETEDSVTDENIGEDLILYIDVTDTITLPDGITLWTGEDIPVIVGTIVTDSDGYENIVFSSGDTVLTLINQSGNSFDTDNYSLAYDSDANALILTYRIVNSTVDDSGFAESEIEDGIWEVRLNGDCLLLTDETAYNDTENSHEITNEVVYLFHYTWSDEVPDDDNVVIPIADASSNVVMTKTTDRSDSVTMGEDASYTITLYNQGTETTSDLVQLADTELDTAQYITPKNIWKMFIGDNTDTTENLAENSGEYLKIVITNALVYYSTPQNIDVLTDINGEETVNKSAASYAITDEPYSKGENATITLTKTEGEDSVIVVFTYNNVDFYTDTVASPEDLEALFLQMGYVVTRDVQYSMYWDLQNYQLAGGETRNYKVYSSVKNTFQYYENLYQNSASSINVADNTVYLSFDNTDKAEEDYKEDLSASASYTSIARDFEVYKSVNQIDGDTEADTDVFYRGSIVTYQLEVLHLGDGLAEDLPLIDVISGSQLLLIPVNEKNKESLVDNSWPIDLDEFIDPDYCVEYDGTTYYIFAYRSRPSVTLSNVWLDDTHCAATVVMESANYYAGGAYNITYTITWNYHEFEASTDILSYNMQIETAEQVTDAHNIVYLNGRYTDNAYLTSALFDEIAATEIKSGSLKKQILTSELGAEEETYAYSSALDLESGKTTVYYKLELNAKSGNGEIEFTNIMDILPYTYGIFTWSEDNVTILSSEYVNPDADPTGEGPGFENEENYDILDSDEDGNLYDSGSTEPPYQTIYWKDTTLPENAEGIWIYVQLDFPTDETTWELYSEAVSGNLRNTFSAEINGNSEPDTALVIHSINREAKAYLQKGVYWINSTTTSTDISSCDSREIYYNSTTDEEDGSLVAYYIQLYNASSTWLYLEDIQDLAPDGFELVALYSGSEAYQDGNSFDPFSTDIFYTDPDNPASCLLDEGGNDLADAGDVSWVEAIVSTTKDEDGTIRFSISGVSKDETTGYCYLQEGEAISFIAEFKVGEESETDVYAENKIAMPYVSLSEGGMSVADVSGKAGQVGSDSTGQPDQNVGGCSVISETDEREYEGFQEVTPKVGTITQWLSSDVTVHRGEIIPGIHKSLDETQDSGVNGSDVVNWNIEVTNDGTISMKNYQITDYVDSPYLIRGEATYYIYDKDENPLLGVRKLSAVDGDGIATFKQADNYFLFKIGRTSTDLYDISWNEKSGNRGNITTQTISDVEARTETPITPSFVVYDSDKAVYGEAYDAAVTVTVSHDDVSGDDIVSINFTGSDLEIPAGGRGVLTIQTQPLDTDSAPVGTYYNLATVTPTQSYDEKEVTIGEAVSASGSTSAYVKSSDQVNVSNGYSTDAQKWIQSIEYPSKIARSEVENVNGVHYIELTGTDESFTYTLEVTNALSYPMTDLVIVDVLPQTGDYPPFTVDNEKTQRGSEFQVDLLTDDIGWQVIKGTKKADSEIEELEKEGDVSALATMEDGYETLTDDPSDPDTEEYYTVHYSTRTSFGYGNTTDSKWADNSTDDEGKVWTDKTEGARAVRIEIHNADIQPNEAVQVSFNAIISADSEDSAEPGEIGWNSFAYKYTTTSVTATVDEESNGTESTTTTLWAAPRKVGVEIPGNPWLTKTIDGIDEESAAEMDDLTFSFLIHEGEQLEDFDYSGSSGNLEELLISELKEAGRKYFTTSLTVDLSEGLSETISLADSRADDDTDKLTWIAGEKYTVVELPSEDSSVPGNGAFAPSNMYLNAGSGNVAGNVITFTYSSSTSVSVTAVNSGIDWWLNVSKQDADTGETLQGVVFGLYSKTKPADTVVEALESSTYSELLSTPSNAYKFTLESDDGEDTETWYLIDVQETDENGAIRWEGLTESVYYLKELKVLDGYYLPADPIRVDYWKTDTEEEEEDTYYSQSSNSSGTIITVTVDNKIGYTLPKTGGRGTLWIQLLGLLLMSMGVSLTYITKRKILSSRRTK